MIRDLVLVFNHQGFLAVFLQLVGILLLALQIVLSEVAALA